MAKRKAKLNLPRVYNNPENNENFKDFEGLPKISYSQIDSWNSELYRGGYIAKYFIGLEDSGNVFSDYGSKVGEWFEKGVDESGDLSAEDLQVLKEKIGRPENCEYEREIVVKRPLGYVIQGFIDRTRRGEWNGKSQLEVVDFKTGNMDKKKSFYAGPDYQQTTLYTHALIEEGEEIIWSGVVLLGRKGNGMEKSPLRLSGDVDSIPTEYSEERINKFFKKVDKTVKEINEYYKVYNKYFAE